MPVAGLRLIGKAVYFPVYEGLSAVEVWSKVTGHDCLTVQYANSEKCPLFSEYSG